MKQLLLSGLTASVIGLLCSLPAHAQATRTWVSGVGDDVNPCSRTAPCKTFAGAISKTAAGGEISVLDPGGFGSVTITKSISITNDGAGEAGILASGTNGIVINAAATDVVNLRGIVIDGAGTTPGLNGIRFLAGGALNVTNCVIKNFTSSSGTGIIFSPASSAKLTVTDTLITRNGLGSTGAGIQIKPTSAAFASVTLGKVTLDNNSNGLVGDASTTTGAVIVTALDSIASSSAATGFALVGGTSANTVLALDRVGSVANTTGVSSTGSGATVLLSNSVVTGNNVAFSATSSGKIISYLNNVLLNNFTASSPTGTQAGQ
jgi:hypothetical protein